MIIFDFVKSEAFAYFYTAIIFIYICLISLDGLFDENFLEILFILLNYILLVENFIKILGYGLKGQKTL